ncbi:MAG: Hsp70 family protein [Rhodococcus sp.]|nr:Hsp70 family protein [Rhodococcus sp. (in: high G+C Gram-positive bacteria)]
MGGWALSIDFGTSNTAAAHTSAVSGRIETLALTHHGNLLPSSVAVGAAPEHAILTGAAAAAEADRNPGAFVASPKRFVGQVPSVRIGEVDVPVEVLISGVLRTVLDRALAAHNRQMPNRVVLTHPEGWSQDQVAVLVNAAARAGIDPRIVVTVSEPRAAAHHYSRAASTEPGTKLAVFDFGGGTLDVAVLTATGSGTFEVVAARGDNGLGGKNFDARLHQWVENTLASDDPEVARALRSAPMHVQRTVDEQVRRAKELLSESPSASISVDTGRHRHTLTITRAEYDQLISGDIDKAAGLARSTFFDAGVAPGQLAALYLTGGSARTPLVHTRIGQLGPIATLDDPKTVVAQGALLAVDRASAAQRGGDTSGGDVPAPTRVLQNPVPPPPVVPPQPVVNPQPIVTPQPPADPEPQGRGRRTWPIVTTAVAALLIATGAAAAVAWSMSGSDDDQGTVALADVVTTTSTTADPVANTTERQVTTAPQQLPKTDILRIGTDLAPGEYAVRPLDASGGYWERLSCLDGDFDCILENAVVEGNGYVKVQSGDVALGVRNLLLTPIAAPVTTTPSVATVAPTVAGTDGQGFVDVPEARCNHTNNAVAIARTTDSLVVVCETGAGRYYYKGVRMADGAAIEIDDPAPSGPGKFTATNGAVQYRLSPSWLVIIDGSDVVGEETMVEYWSK